MERLGLEKWEDSDLRIKGSGSKKSPRSRSEEKGILEAYLEEGGGVQSGVGRWSGCQKTKGGLGTHRHLASLALTPPGPPLAPCTAGSVSKDVCLFLEQRFISFHFNCLLLSWACESAGLCYKGEPQPCGPDMAASCMAKSVFWFMG